MRYLVLKVAAGTMNKDEFAAWVNAHLSARKL